MKAKICKLLMKLYIDQEPRRTQILPELCKVVHISEKDNLGNNMIEILFFKKYNNYFVLLISTIIP